MAYAALVSLSHTIHQFLNLHQFSISLHNKQQITSIHEYSVFLQVFFENSQERGNSLEGRIRDLANQAEDIIEYFMLEQIRLRYMSINSTVGPSISKFIHYPGGKYTHFHVLNEVADQIESIAGEVKVITNRFRFKDERLGDSPTASSSSRLASSHEKDVAVGFNDDLLAIKDRLCGKSPKLRAVSIIGMGGIGKTTLARNVYHDPLITESFLVRAWVTVSQDYSPQKVLSDLLASVKESDTEKSGQSNELGLYQSLKGKKYLIVMDDMWSTKAWDDIKMIFPDDSNGSRVMLTTRLSDVAAYADSSSDFHEMNLMDGHQSWNLFQREVFEKEHCPLELENIGKEIVRSCGGLPLAIVVIAGILSTVNKTRASWTEIAENVKSAIATEKDGQFEKILSLSYTHLPHHLRPCFLYMGAFPEDHEIRVAKLIKLWLAEGFLKQSEAGNIEEMAGEYLEDLVKRSLVLVSRKKSNGKIKVCKLHDVIRELCIRKAREEQFLLNVVNKQVPKKSIRNQRRVCFYKCHRHLYSLAKFNGSTTRTIICFWRVAISIKNLRYFRFLRVLDLESVYFIDFVKFPSLPTQLFELFHLRYLAFNYVTEIPAAVSNLQNLQTLIIHLSKEDLGRSNVSLPLGIWTMQRLRHLKCLYFEKLPNPEEGAPTCCALDNLQTLSGVRDLVCTESILKMIPNLKKLVLRMDEIGADHHLENLVHLQQLEKLKLIVSPSRYEVKVSPVLPRTLKKLTLSGQAIPLAYMITTIGSFPNLQVLKLRKCSREWKEWETSDGGFPSLEYLLIEDPYLEEWITESSHFPSLKCLILHTCWSLFDIPSGIGEIPTLELIEVIKGINGPLAESAKRMQEEQRDYGNDVLQVRFVGYTFDQRGAAIVDEPIKNSKVATWKSVELID